MEYLGVVNPNATQVEDVPMSNSKKSAVRHKVLRVVPKRGDKNVFVFRREGYKNILIHKDQFEFFEELDSNIGIAIFDLEPYVIRIPSETDKPVKFLYPQVENDRELTIYHLTVSARGNQTPNMITIPSTYNSIQKCCVTGKVGFLTAMLSGENGKVFHKSIRDTLIRCPITRCFVEKIPENRHSYHGGTAYLSKTAIQGLVRCHHTNVYVHYSHAVEINGNYYTQSAAQQLFRQCTRCSAFVPQNDIRERPDASRRSLCPHCYERYMNNPINNYTFRPTPIFQKYRHENTKLFYGMEFELSVKQQYNLMSVAKKIRSFVNEEREEIYCKSDSSVPNGFEMVTHPGTFNFFTKKSKVFEGIFYMRKYLIKHPRCGVHIHVSRDGFVSKTHQFKFVNFINRHQDALWRFSSRHERDNHYCGYYHTRPNLFLSNHLMSVLPRHVSVNLQNRQTIEVRIFNMYTHVPKLLSYLEFCDSLYYYSLEKSIKQMTWDGFIKWNEKKWKRYKNLINYLYPRR